MIKITKIRYQGSEKLFNRFSVYTPLTTYMVKRPITEKSLTSIEVIMNCKNEEELFNIGGYIPPKDGKISLEEYFLNMGLT